MISQLNDPAVKAGWVRGFEQHDGLLEVSSQIEKFSFLSIFHSLSFSSVTCFSWNDVSCTRHWLYYCRYDQRESLLVGWSKISEIQNRSLASFFLKSILFLRRKSQHRLVKAHAKDYLKYSVPGTFASLHLFASFRLSNWAPMFPTFFGSLRFVWASDFTASEAGNMTLFPILWIALIKCKFVGLQVAFISWNIQGVLMKCREWVFAIGKIKLVEWNLDIWYELGDLFDYWNII